MMMVIMEVIRWVSPLDRSQSPPSLTNHRALLHLRGHADRKRVGAKDWLVRAVGRHELGALRQHDADQPALGDLSPKVPNRTGPRPRAVRRDDRHPMLVGFADGEARRVLQQEHAWMMVP